VERNRIQTKEVIIMTTVRQVTRCTTAVVRELDKQLIAQINLIIPNVLVSFADLNADVGSPVWPLLQPPAKAGLRRAINERGIRMNVNSAYRTIAQQLILFNNAEARRCGISIAAPPGRSNHQSGLAIDVDDAAGWEPFLERHGWRRLLPSDPVHFDYIGRGTRDIRVTAVRAFQQLWNLNNRNNRLAVDGDYGPRTARALNNAPVAGLPIGEKFSLEDFKRRLGSRVLRLSDPILEGEDVRQLQEALNKAGFEIEVDSFFGRSTEQIVKQFQKKKGLKADGIVGQETLEALELYVEPIPPSPTFFRPRV
jgi:N-acetylmuramoyl-L-alanine amidase